MRKLLIVTVVFSLIGCSSYNPVDVQPNLKQQLVGTWQWVESCGGFAGWCIYADSVDYTRALSFFANDTYTEAYNEAIVRSGRYWVVKKEVPMWGKDTADVLIRENAPMEMLIRTVRNDSLELDDICYDCFGHLYLRVGGGR
ncbi:MAG: hypothetical protein AB1744_01950 [Candidatus Zixiibacteriota bacterium]